MGNSAGSAGKDMVSVLVTDHEEVKELFRQIESTSDAKTRRDLADQMTAELIRHSVAEEQHLYPATRAALPDGDQIADHEIEEHSEAEEGLKRLEGVAGDDPQFMTIFAEVRDGVLHHIEEEEGDLFPRLQATMTADQLVELGEKITAAKKIAPTRPHPSAPDTPPLNKVMGPLTGLVDRLRDRFSGRST
ncbi:MAG: hemerythrin domain-containing protein [Nocardioidaceae bacterium]